MGRLILYNDRCYVLFSNLHVYHALSRLGFQRMWLAACKTLASKQAMLRGAFHASDSSHRLSVNIGGTLKRFLRRHVVLDAAKP